MLNSTPATWSPGEIPTAAKLNTQIRDAVAGIQGEWAPYICTWSSTGTQVDIGNGAFSAYYHRIGKTIWFRIELLMGSTTNYGTGQYSFSLPVPAEGNGRLPFTGILRDFSAGDNYPILGLLDPAGAVIAIRQYTSGGPLANVGQGAPITLGVNDLIILHGTYEAA